MLVLLEDHANYVLENLDDYEDVFAAIDLPNIGMCLDTGHFAGAGITLSSVLEELHSPELHADLKGCASFGQGYNTVKLGEGDTDFDGFLADLLARGHAGYPVIGMAW